MNLIQKAKACVKTLIGEHSYIALRNKYNAYRYRSFKSKLAKSKLVFVRVGNIDIKAPETHTILEFCKSQPYRDLAVGITAKYVSEKYPGETIIDIGANIGDTAAMIATYSSNPLVLVEPSDYFAEILVNNVKYIPSVKRIERCMVSDNTVLSGELRLARWGGTARFETLEHGGQLFYTKRLDEISEIARLVKIDTDGFDFSIINSGIDWLSRVQPLLYYENEIRDLKSLNESNDVLKNLSKVGYHYFIVWDDPGFHMVSTGELDALFKLNRYLFKLWISNYPKTICNYDILCVPSRDKDIFQAVTKYYMEY
jgi:FkbM family methyltransferase